MTTASPIKLTSADVARLAERYLEPHQPADWRLEVQMDQIRQDGDWWEVVVHPSRRDAYSYEYYGRLSAAEEDLQAAEDVKVLLVPLLPPGGD